MVAEALKKAGREDLIGWEKDCLITPYERRSAEKKPENGKKTGFGKKPVQKTDKPTSKAKKQEQNRIRSVENSQKRGPKHPTKGGGKRGMR